MESPTWRRRASSLFLTAAGHRLLTVTQAVFALADLKSAFKMHGG